MSDSIRKLSEQAKVLREEADRRQSRLDRAEAAAKGADKPYEDRINAIATEQHNTNAAFYAETEAARKAVWAETTPDPRGPMSNGRVRPVTFSAAAEIAENLLEAAKAERHVPTDAEGFETYLKAGAGPFGDFARLAYALTVRKPTACGPFILLSADDSDSYGKAETRIYLAVSGDPNYRRTNGATQPPKVVGWLKVEPSQHRGDETRAEGRVFDKPFLLSRVWWNRDKDDRKPVDGGVVRKPLAQFKAALKGENVEKAESGGKADD